MSQTIAKRKSGSRRVSLKLDTESHVEQSHKGETDINSIMRKYRKTGVLPQVQSGSVYGEFATEDDYHTTQDKLLAAQGMFMDLPSEVRSRFNNDAGAFFGFINDSANQEEAIDMGLIANPNKKAPVPISRPSTPPEASTEPATIPSASSD